MDLTTLSNLFPGMLMWKKDLHSVFTEANLIAVKNMGYQRVEQIIGKRDEEHPSKLSECALIFQRADLAVITEKTTKKFIEVLCCANDEWKILLVTKNPNVEAGILRGTFGFCEDITIPFAKLGFTLVKKKNAKKLLQSCYVIDSGYGNLKLPEKQARCLFHLLRGKTAKQIAEMMRVSPRTAEFHINALKRKFNCTHKSELIEKALSKQLQYVLPEFILQEQQSIIL